MGTTKRIIIGIIVIALLAAAILLVESTRRGSGLYRMLREGSERFSGACIPVYRDSALLARFCSENAAPLPKKGFVDTSEHKPQEGWLLRDALLLFVRSEDMAPGARVRVSSSSRNKRAELAWDDIANEANLVILAPTKQGTLKLASRLKGLDTREAWVQEVDRIEILRP